MIPPESPCIAFPQLTEGLALLAGLGVRWAARLHVAGQFLGAALAVIADAADVALEATHS